MTSDEKTAILIFGTFNPITNAHLELGKRSGRQITNADVYYVPSAESYLKGWKKLDEDAIFGEEDRLSLLKSVLEPYGFAVSDIEIRGLVSGKTYDTVTYFKTVCGYREIYLVFGSDKLSEICYWFNADRLLRENRFLVFLRNGEDGKSIEKFEPCIRERFIVLENDEKLQYVSATKVRECYRNGDLTEIREAVPKEVYQFLSGEKGGHT